MNLIDRLRVSEDDKDKMDIARELSDMGNEGMDLLLDALKSDRDLRILLVTLLRVISNEKNRDYLADYYKRTDYRPLIDYVKNNDAKVRKNAYIIMGEIKSGIILSSLLDALGNETTFFNIPSILLALGNVGDRKIIDDINNRVDEIVKTKGVSEKHLKEIIRAKDKCIDKLMGDRNRHSFMGFRVQSRILMTTMQGKERFALQEVRQYYPQAKMSGCNIEIVTDDYSKIPLIRSYYEWFIVPSQLEDMPFDKNIILKTLRKYLSYDYIHSMHKGEGMYRYRLEIAANQDKSRLMDDFIYLIDKAFDNKLLNSPSNYELELRIIVDNQRCSCYIKLYTVQDKRFNYRINDIPASIKGENAAIVMRLMRGYLKEGAKVLDPFVGTGTMLVERQYLSPTSSLTGVDIVKDTLVKAKENLQMAGVDARLIREDITRLNSSIKYDEIISNMPYGLRVGSHKRNERLYKAFIDKIPHLLKPEGIAILLTADYRLLKSLAKDKLELIDERVINTGGLFPHLQVYKLR